MVAAAIGLLLATSLVTVSWGFELARGALDDIDGNRPPPSAALPLPPGWRLVDESQCDSGCISIDLTFETTVRTAAEAREELRAAAADQEWTASGDLVASAPFEARVLDVEERDVPPPPGTVRVELAYTSEAAAIEDREQARRWLVPASIVLAIAWLTLLTVAARSAWMRARR